MAGSVPGARIGSRLTVGASDRTIRRRTGLFPAVLALVHGGVRAASWVS